MGQPYRLLDELFREVSNVEEKRAKYLISYLLGLSSARQLQCSTETSIMHT